MTELTLQQKRFVEEYKIDGQARKAAIRAGYSPNSAAAQASRLLKHPLIKKELSKAMAESATEMGITPERVIQELALIGFSNLKDIITLDEEGNTQVDWKNVPRDAASALSKISIETITRGDFTQKKVQIGLNDKLSALVTLGKHLNIFRDRVEHEVNLSLEQLVEGSYKEDNIIDAESVEVKGLEDNVGQGQLSTDELESNSSPETDSITVTTDSSYD